MPGSAGQQRNACPAIAWHTKQMQVCEEGLGGASPLSRRGIQRQGEGEWAGEALACPDVKQEVKLPLALSPGPFSLCIWIFTVTLRGQLVNSPLHQTLAGMGKEVLGKS